jgi:transposase
LKRTWAPRRQTPVIRTSLEHNARLNLIGGLGISPAQRQIKLRIQAHRKPISGDEVIRFLTHLARHIRGAIVVVWDRHPIHGRRQVKEWLAQHPRFHVYAFPTSAPELNPTEWVWAQIKESTASTAPHNAAELRTNVLAGVARTRRSPSRLWACIFGTGLAWERTG